MDKKKILNLLKENSEYLRKTYGVSKIGLFGSFQGGQGTKTSDVDLLVSFQKGHKDFFNYMRLKSYLEDTFDREVDLVTEQALKDRLKDKIMDQVEYVER